MNTMQQKRIHESTPALCNVMYVLYESNKHTNPSVIAIRTIFFVNIRFFIYSIQFYLSLTRWLLARIFSFHFIYTKTYNMEREKNIPSCVCYALYLRFDVTILVSVNEWLDIYINEKFVCKYAHVYKSNRNDMELNCMRLCLCMRDECKMIMKIAFFLFMQLKTFLFSQCKGIFSNRFMNGYEMNGVKMIFSRPIKIVLK